MQCSICIDPRVTTIKPGGWSTDGLEDPVGLESWGCLHSKALIKPEKTREEPKSTAAGEREEFMLKRRSLLWFVSQFGMRTHGNEAPA